MSPIFAGVVASGISGHLYTPVGSYDALATIVVPSGGLSEITFSGIPSEYRHLQIRAIARGNRTPVTYDAFNIRFNGDTGSNYSYHTLYGDGRAGSPFADNGSSMTSIPAANIPGSGSLANSFGALVIDILDINSSTKTKTVRSINGYDSNTTGWGSIYSTIAIISGGWFSTNPINSVTIIPQNSPLQEFSHFAIYGVK